MSIRAKQESLSRGSKLGASVRPRKRPGLNTVGLYFLLCVASIATVFPFFAMVMVSLQPPGPLSLSTLFDTSSITLENFMAVMQESRIIRWTFNSFIYSAVSVVLSCLTASLAAYAFAKKAFPGREILFWTFIAMLMVPAQITLIPLFVLIAQQGGIDSYWGLILPTVASVPAVFIFRQFMEGIPNDLLDAAKIDGASDFRIYWQIVLPQTGPVMATMGTFIFLWHWNDFIWPLIVTQSDATRTLTVGLASLQARIMPLGELMAGATLSFIPTLIVFVVVQRYFIRGAMMSGLK